MRELKKKILQSVAHVKTTALRGICLTILSWNHILSNEAKMGRDKKENSRENSEFQPRNGGRKTDLR